MRVTRCLDVPCETGATLSITADSTELVELVAHSVEQAKTLPPKKSPASLLKPRNTIGESREGLGQMKPPCHNQILISEATDPTALESCKMAATFR